MTESQKLDLILLKLEKFDVIDSILEKLDTIEAELKRFDAIESELTRFDVIEDKLKRLDDDINSIKLIIEDEIRGNIQRIAEGHLDLSRRLHEALKPNKEVEMLSVRVNVLETDVRELKTRLC